MISEGGRLLQEDQHFITWMRTAALKNFRKLWGRVEQTIPAGATITVTVQNRCEAGAWSSSGCHAVGTGVCMPSRQNPTKTHG